MASAHASLAERLFAEAWNQRCADPIDELLMNESMNHSESGPLRGRREFKEQVYAVFLEAFPDLHLTVEGTVADGDEVVVRWVAKGTHRGNGLGFPATGREVSFKGMTWIRYANGKKIEGWDCWDSSALVQALRTSKMPEA